MVSARKGLLVLVSGLAFAGSALASDDTKIVSKPYWKGHYLDWCLNWATDCGKPAADAYCKATGYDEAINFSIWENHGNTTRLIGSNQVCDDDDVCDGFLKITCKKAGEPDEPEEVTYKKPKAGNRRLDWCLTWATNCGKPAADYYCEKRGHDEATDFKIAENIGKTRILKTGELCTDPTCDGFKFITCE